MTELIARLDDATAQRILASIARAQVGSGAQELAWTGDLRQALAGAFEVSGQPQPPASTGDLARQALLLLAEHPATREAIAAMAEHAPETRERFDLGTTVALTAAVLVVLQTHIRFERDKDGRWSLQVEKGPTSDTLLKPLVEKLLGFAPKAGG